MALPDQLADSTQAPSAQRLVLGAGLVVGLCIMGDSLLYNLLPLEAQNLSIPVALVGVLLSANRVVRLLSNTWISRSFERWGPRIPFVLSTVLALITTAGYGLSWGFVVFLLARIGWGMAWSGLRQGGYQAVWAGGEAVRGRLMGSFWGIVRLGSAGSVLLGGFLRDRFGYQTAILAVAGLTAAALPAGLLLRWPAADGVAAPENQAVKTKWYAVFKTAPQRWLLAAGLVHSVLEGVLTASVSTFLAGRLDTDGTVGVATVAGILLAVRWLSGLLFGPALGWLSDRLGRPRTAGLLVTVMLISLVGTVAISDTWLLVFISLVFVAGAGLFVTLSAAANSLALQADRPHQFVGIYTTAADAGLAVGPVLAFSIGNRIGFDQAYLITAVCLLITVAGYGWSGKSISI